PVTTLIPTRSRLALLFPDGLWHADPSRRRTGGYAWKKMPLSPVEIAFWRACNGARTTRAAAEVAGLELPQAEALLERLCDPLVQAIQLRENPLERRDPSLERILCPDALPGPRSADQYGSAGETTLEAWHQRITGGEAHFDNVETTVAHAFGLPHPALNGQRYGERLHDVFEDRGWIRDHVVEVGPGDGELAEAFLARAGGWVDYLRIDITPELLRTQRQRLPQTREMLGSATRLPIPDRSVELLFSNEVIADLSAVPYDADRPAEGAAIEVAERLRRYRIPAAPGSQLYNLGAWIFLEEIARVLKPGGVAWISEFGGPEDPPEEAIQLDHPEVSIHFGQLVAVARALGLEATLEPMGEFLRFDPRAFQLWRGSYEGLRARFRSEGGDLTARAWTPETLPRTAKVEGLLWVQLSEPGAGPLLSRFWCLSLRQRR
ncbi:MAG TPA: class I SAM-dependent methyltransferase, partial [Myxococcota bacterium]|nr:class I SAM-dependent methyltransferase [Myxococcota bacterium]